MKFLRGFFGDPAEALEEKGDALRLAGHWREAAWFYRRALDKTGDGGRRERLAIREQEASHEAFRLLLEEAESQARRRMRTEALETLGDAEDFAVTDEDRSIVRARRQRLLEGTGHEPATGGTTSGPAVAEKEAADHDASGSDHEPGDPPADPGEALRRAFRDRLVGRPESERRRLRTLGEAGQRGFVALGAGDYAAALEAFEREVAASPDSWVCRELMAQSLEWLGRVEEAQRQYEAAYQRAPDHHVLVLEVARLLRERLNQPAAALERLDRAAKRHPPSGETMNLHLERVFLLVDLGRGDEAVALLGELVAAPGVDHGLLYFNRAGLLEQSGRLEEAEADLTAAVEAAPSNVLYLERFADLVFRARRDLEGSLVLLDRALAIDAHDFAARRGGLGTSPDRARLQFKAARILYLLDRLPEARARVDEGLIVCHDPRVEEALLELRRDLWSADDANT